MLKFCQRVWRRAVKQVNQQSAALNVSQKLMPQPGSFGGSLNQTGDVGQHHIPVVHNHYAQMGLKCGKGIIGNFGLGGTNYGEKGAFAGIGYTHQAHIGNEF